MAGYGGLGNIALISQVYTYRIDRLLFLWRWQLELAMAVDSGKYFFFFYESILWKEILRKKNFSPQYLVLVDCNRYLINIVIVNNR